MYGLSPDGFEYPNFPLQSRVRWLEYNKWNPQLSEDWWRRVFPWLKWVDYNVRPVRPVWGYLNDLFEAETGDFIWRRKSFDIGIFGPKGMGKSLLAMALAKRFDPTFIVETRMRSNKADFIVLLGDEAKFRDAWKIIFDNSGGSKGKLLDEFLELALNERSFIEDPERDFATFYEGLMEDEIPEAFDVQLEKLMKENIVEKVGGRIRCLKPYEETPEPRVFVCDEVEDAHGPHRIIMADKFQNIIRFSRVLNVITINAGVSEPPYLRMFMYVLRPIPEWGLYDPREPYKLKRITSELYVKGDSKPFWHIGYVCYDAPSDMEIERYLEIEKLPSAHGMFSSGGLAGIQSMRNMRDRFESVYAKPPIGDRAIENIYEQIRDELPNIRYNKELKTVLRSVDPKLEVQDIDKIILWLRKRNLWTTKASSGK